MIEIHFSPDLLQIGTWKIRLEKTILKYTLIEEPTALVPYLLDNGKKVEGISAIDAYLEVLEQFEKDWYEDRCDKYEFDPDAPPGLKLPPFH